MTTHLPSEQGEEGLSRRGLVQALAAGTAAASIAAPSLAQQTAAVVAEATSPDYARKRVKAHLLRFITLHEQLTVTRVDETFLKRIEWLDNIFPEVNYRYWDFENTLTSTPRADTKAS